VHRIVPELIIENFRAGRHRGNFAAASLFLDIHGFSSMTDTLMGQGRDGAEVLADTMRLVFDPMAEAIFGHGGWIVGYAGDSVSALFPLGEDVAASANRAMAAAITIQRALAMKSEITTHLGAFKITAKIGLGLGSVSWGILPSPTGRRAIYYFRGEAVDEAARAEHQAGKGEILLTDNLLRALDMDIPCTRVGDVNVLAQAAMEPLPQKPIELPDVDAEAGAAFVPSELIRRDLAGEFRQTVHLAIQLPELSDEQLRVFTDSYFWLQSQYGGLLDRVDFGDKGCHIVVFWGAPTAHENDIDRALNFALDLRRQLPFPITAGVTYYISYAGYIGARLFESYAAYGWGISMAARFMTYAPAGEIWLDERIYARARERFELDSVGERLVKGFAEKQKIHRLLGRRTAPGLHFRGQMVGRVAETAALTAFVEPLWSGKYAGVTGIWGEAGVGKSRLAHEFRQTALFRDHPCMWAICQTDEILRRSLNPFRYWLAQYFDIQAGQTRATQTQNLTTKIDELIAAVQSETLGAELRRARTFIAPLVGLEWPDPLYEQLDAQGRYDNTINALISLIKAESRRQPVIMLIEDAHYLDEDSKAFIPRLKRAFAADPIAHPLAILMTTRWEGTRTLLEEGLIDQDIDLGGLADEPVGIMSVEILGGPAAPSLVQLVNDRAGGNPFYVQQILRYLKEHDRLVLDPLGEWAAREPFLETSLPADIRAMLVSRLDQLPERVRQMVQAASILGRVVDLPVLQLMLGAGERWGHEIAAAEHAAIWSPLSETRYIFDHELLRDAAYNMQLHSRRQELHGRAFDALRDLFGNERHQHHGALAYHSQQAGKLAEARHHYSLAAEAARDGFHIAQALDFYQRALQAHPNVDLEDDFRLHLARQNILAEHGTLDDKLRELEQVQDLADRLGDPGRQAEVMLIRARVMASRGYYDRSEEAALLAEHLGASVGLPRISIDARIAILDAAFHRGRYEDALKHGDAALLLARAHGAAEAEATILNKLGMAYLEMKNPSAARTYFEQSLAQFRSSDNVRGVARVLTNLGSVAGLNGNYSTALDYYEQTLRLAREFGSRKGECLLLGNTAEFDLAQTCALRGLQMAREIGDRLTETFCLIHLSARASSMGDCPTAIEYAEQALELARHSDHKNLQAWALTYQAHAHAGCGRDQEAIRAYASALEIRRSLNQHALASEPASALARLAADGGDTQTARDHIEVVLAELEQDGTLEGTDQPLRVYLNCFLVLQKDGDSRAKGILNSAHDMLRTRANGIADPARRRAFLETIPYNREILSLWEAQHQRTSPTSSPLADRPT
jgi:class 3 adenylate cyclase/tetratricopeptide (TPR) repeat protein